MGLHLVGRDVKSISNGFVTRMSDRSHETKSKVSYEYNQIQSTCMLMISLHDTHANISFISC